MKDNTDRLEQIVDFCRLTDKEKFIRRRTYLTDGQRLENDAEHAWHLAVMALLLCEYANEEVDLLKVVSMVLIHDLVEIYAGDTFAYDKEGIKTQKAREEAAADRLFPRLPEDLAEKFRGLWEEFEAMETPDARYAAACDRLQPLLHTYLTDAIRIFPLRPFFTISEIEFAKECREIAGAGKANVRWYTSLLDPFLDGRDGPEILRTLARQYDVEIYWHDESLKQYTFSGELKRYDSIDTLLRMIEHTDNVRFTVHGRQVIVARP